MSDLASTHWSGHNSASAADSTCTVRVLEKDFKMILDRYIRLQSDVCALPHVHRDCRTTGGRERTDEEWHAVQSVSDERGERAVSALWAPGRLWTGHFLFIVFHFCFLFPSRSPFLISLLLSSLSPFLSYSFSDFSEMSSINFLTISISWGMQRSRLKMIVVGEGGMLD